MVCRKFLKKDSFFRLTLYATCDLFESNYPFYAASIAYYTIMSVIPLFIFLFFLGMTILHVNFRDLIPAELLSSPLKPIFLRIEELIGNSGIISGTAALFMLWFSRGIFLSLEESFCEILKVESPSNFLYKNLAIILAIFFLWILLFIFYITKYAIAILLPQLPVLSFLSSLLVPILLFTILVSTYYFMLPVSVPFSFIVKISSFVFTVLLIFEKVFVWFILNVSKVNILYGSFAALIVSLLWIYYSATVILLGVGIVKGKLIAEREE
ncbi:MAG: YihY/virulence factor BrkB family protein [Desulfurobacterium sp.]|nr:MAG: YihY/virulence factor BrkB family protein [Desulfurobacterium sp.]